MHPFADTFIEKSQFGSSEPVYPLQCALDKDSGEIKLIYDTKADERYNLYKYSYTSSNSKFVRPPLEAIKALILPLTTSRSSTVNTTSLNLKWFLGIF